MFLLCREDLPDGFDPSNKKQFGKAWVTRYLDRQGLSVRMPTNKKKASVFERLHKIHGFHWYCVYQMAYAPISSTETESSSSESSYEESSSYQKDSLITPPFIENFGFRMAR